jgi:hypothetical protein
MGAKYDMVKTWQKAYWEKKIAAIFATKLEPNQCSIL